MPKKHRKTTPGPKSTEVRLNKYIADCGIASRRKADELIDEGHVQVNGKTAYEMGAKINPQTDTVKVRGKLIKPESHKVYYAFNKPVQVLTSMEDPTGRPTIADFFPKSKERLFPVGRLDWDSEGLLLVTNDGDFAQRILHPREEIPKTYWVKLDGSPSMAQLEKLKKGISIVGGKAKALRVRRLKRGASQKYDWVEIVITEGRNRQVRRMFEKIGFDVKKLRRVAIGGLKLGKLPKGGFVPLRDSQIRQIFKTSRQSEKSTRRGTSPTKKKRSTSSKRVPKK